GGIIKASEKVELAEVTDAEQSGISSTTAEKKQAQKLAAETLTKLKSHPIIESEVREAITSQQLPIELNPEKQARHMVGTAPESSSVITISSEELQEVINSKAGTGKLMTTKSKKWSDQEVIDAGRIIGYTVNLDGVKISTSRIKIHYSKTGTHAVPYSGEEEPQ
ncbi:MAG: polymorphic toxin type 50 domain-containing protein, partial [Firmicutes bacterium]|nr:polymorphic toxin type 50 domain-containing protein [Bacillota bacterium]